MKRTTFAIITMVSITTTFLLGFALTATAQTCVCVCGPNDTRGPVSGIPSGATAAKTCQDACALRTCGTSACTMDATKSTCDDPPPGTTGGGTDSACTKEINGVVFPCDPLEVKTGPKDWIRNAVEIVLQLVGAGAFLLSIYGGGLILFARGDPKKVSEGRKVVVYAAIGLIVILLSYFMLNVIFSVIQEAITS